MCVLLNMFKEILHKFQAGVFISTACHSRQPKDCEEGEFTTRKQRMYSLSHFLLGSI